MKPVFTRLHCVLHKSVWWACDARDLYLKEKKNEIPTRHINGNKRRDAAMFVQAG